MSAYAKLVLRVLQQASHPMSIAEAAQAVNLPEPTVRRAVERLHALDAVVPANNRRRGRVWLADRAASVPDDRRGRIAACLANLRRGRGYIWES